MTLLSRVPWPRTRRGALLATLAALAIPAAAYAAWLVLSGDGTGSGRFGQLATPTFVRTNPVPAGLAPCLPAGICDTSVYITNPNSFPLHAVEVVAADAGENPLYGTTALCRNYVRAHLGPIDPPVLVLPGSNEVTLPGAIEAHADTPTSCQGAEFMSDTVPAFKIRFRAG